MHLYGRRGPVEALLEEPVGGWRPTLDAPLPFGLAPFCRSDGLPDGGELEGEPYLDGAEPGEVGWEVVHVFSLRQYSNTRSNQFMAQHKVDYLTDQQQRILSVIRRSIADTGEAPTVAELRAATGRSTGAVVYQLRELEAKCAIRREPGRPRGIRLA